MRRFMGLFGLIALVTCAQSRPQRPEELPVDAKPAEPAVEPAKPATEPAKPATEPEKPAETPPSFQSAPAGSTGTPLYVPAPTNQPLPRMNEKSPLGMNLVRVRDYFSEYTFVDAMKRSRAWVSGGQNRNPFLDTRPLDLDEHGWVKSLKPDQAARVQFFWGKGIKIPEGDYVVLYDGQGKVDYVNAKIIDSRPGRHVIQPDVNQLGFALSINQTNPSDPVRNIRVLMPGGVCANDPYKACRRNDECGAGGKTECIPFERNYREQIYHPAFLNLVKDFSVLRFTDWFDTNENEHQKGKWDDRPKLTDARYTIKGVPVELAIDLSNRLSADPWISVPYLADDEYITNLATFIKENLRPGLKVYVEHSNETWNGVFAQARWVRQQAQENKVAGSPAEAATRIHARRSVHIFKIFEKVLGKERLVRVMGSFIALPMMSETALAFEDAYKNTDALTVAPYFGIDSDGEKLNKIPSMTVDEVFAEMRGPQKERMANWLEKHAAIAKKYKVKLIAYEGGDHLNTPPMLRDNVAVNTLFDAASRDPRMKDLHLEYLKLWKSKGGELYTAFVSCAQPSAPGRFGTVEYLHQPPETAPKLQALRTFIQTTPRWW